jgi:hypothetical protein
MDGFSQLQVAASGTPVKCVIRSHVHVILVDDFNLSPRQTSNKHFGVRISSSHQGTNAPLVLLSFHGSCHDRLHNGPSHWRRRCSGRGYATLKSTFQEQAIYSISIRQHDESANLYSRTVPHLNMASSAIYAYLAETMVISASFLMSDTFHHSVIRGQRARVRLVPGLLIQPIPALFQKLLMGRVI